MKKGFTILEIILACAIMSILLVTLSSMIKTNGKVFTVALNEKVAYDNLRNIENFIVDRLKNAEELEILGELPDTLAEGYNYIYSDGGDVYYIHDRSLPIEITDSSNELFEIVFKKIEPKLLDIDINAINISDNSKNTRLNLSNLTDGTEITGLESGNIVKFVTNIIDQGPYITYFSFRSSDNGNPHNWILNEYVAEIDQTGLQINVTVDEEFDLTSLIPYVIHDGDEITFETTTSQEGSGSALDFSNIVYATVKKPTGEKTYEINVNQKSVPKLISFGFKAIDNNGETPYIGQTVTTDRIGYINQKSREVMVTIDNIGASNRNLVPYFEIEGDFIEIDGKRLYPGDKMPFNFNQGRTFTKYEYATSNPSASDKIKNEAGTAVYANEYVNLKPTMVKVYALAADGVTLRSRSYEVYVSPYGYSLYLAVKDTSNNVYTAWIDQEKLKIYLPTKSGTALTNGKFLTRYAGDDSSVKDTYGPYWNIFDKVQDNQGLVEYTSVDNISTRTYDTLNNYNNFVYDKVYDDRNSGKKLHKDDIEQMDKFYDIVYQQAGVFKFFYENTLAKNRYLYKEKIEAEIIQPTSGYALSTVGNGNTSQMGQINITLPQNEYQENMVASFSFMGKETTTSMTDKSKISQMSEVTENNLQEGKIVEYYLKSEIADIYYRYKFNVIESAAPTIELLNKSLNISGSGENKTLSIQEYLYIKGINRDEKTDGTEYRWYFVSEDNKDKVGTEKGVILSCTTKDFKIEDYKEQFLGKGYVYGAVRTRSDTYEVDGVEYGGVYTNWAYTDSVEVDYGTSLVIVPEYGIFAGNEGDDAINMNGIYMDYFDSNDTYSMRSNGGIILPVRYIYTARTLYLDYIKNWVDSFNNATYRARVVKRTTPEIEVMSTPDYTEYMEKSIEILKKRGDVYEVSNKATIDINKGTVDGNVDNLKDWIIAKDIDITGTSTTSPKSVYGIKSDGGTINWDSGYLHNTATSTKPIILYQPNGGTINISTDFYYDKNYIFIYAPNSTVNINSGTIYANINIIAKQVNSTTIYPRLNELEKIILPQ